MSMSSRPDGPGDRARDPAPAGTDAEIGAEAEDPYGFPRGVPAIGGHFPDSRPRGPQSGGRRAGLPVEPRLTALNRDYPAWRIIWFRCSDGSPGGWWAMRHSPLTATQRAAGLLACIARGDVISLVSEITVQDDIAARLVECASDAGQRQGTGRRVVPCQDGHQCRQTGADIENTRDKEREG